MGAATSVAEGRSDPGRGGKGIADVVTYALSHRTRIRILIVLNQGVYSPTEIAEIIGESLKNTAHHLRTMADDGAIEVAYTKRRRNFEQSFYRAVESPWYSEQELAELHPFQRQMVMGQVVQSLLAEVLASLFAGKLRDDPKVAVVWNRLDLDQKGRKDVTEAQERHWQELESIREESALRAALSGDVLTPYIVSVISFERALKAPSVD